MQTVLIFCVRDCIILLICFAGRVAGSPSISRDRQGHQNLNLFFLFFIFSVELEVPFTDRMFFISSLVLLIKRA